MAVYKVPQQHKEHGTLYGYPRCCIDAFLPFFMRSEAYLRQYRTSAYDQTGYMPCERCLTRDPQDVIKEINEARNPLLRPFELRDAFLTKEHHAH